MYKTRTYNSTNAMVRLAAKLKSKLLFTIPLPAARSIELSTRLSFNAYQVEVFAPRPFKHTDNECFVLASLTARFTVITRS